MANVVEAVKAELKREKIKLWVQPYLQDGDGPRKANFRPRHTPRLARLRMYLSI